MSDSVDKYAFFSYQCWTDGSGYEFDGEPNNLVGIIPGSEQFFSMTGKMAKNLPDQWNLWSNWIDKFQTDYRFLLLSDYNAETILQPNIDDPWMFTEYVFKGTGKIFNEKENSLNDIDVFVVEPPLYDENTLLLINADREAVVEQEDMESNSSENEKNSKRRYGYDYEIESSKYNKDRVIYEGKEWVKTCRTVSDIGWDIEKKNRESNIEFPVNDSGVKLYRVTINVESVKWGEHGNIPPHTLNMVAPDKWIDVKTKKTIQPITVAKVGYPVYATIDGMFYHSEESNEDYIREIAWTTEEGEGNFTVFNYDVIKEGGVLQSKGVTVANVQKNEMSLRYIEQATSGDIIHTGCEFFVGRGGACRCTAVDENDLNYSNSLKLDRDACMSDNSSCPGWIKKSATAISTYETVAHDRDQYLASTYGLYETTEEKFASNMLTATNAMGGLAGGMGAFIAFGMLTNITTYYQPGLKDYSEPNVYFETSFKFIEEPIDPVQISPTNPQGYGNGTIVVRGSGYQVINESVPWKGGDNYAVGDMDQINYTKFMQSVMPCYNSDYCNELCGLAMMSGYDPSSKAGSKTQNSDDTGGEFIDYCRYYKSADKTGEVECPYDSIPKTAYEYQEAQILARSSLTEQIQRWISTYDERIDINNIVDKDSTMFVKHIVSSKDPDTNIIIPEHFILYGKNDESTRFGGINCSQKEELTITERTFDSEGKEILETKKIEAYKICKFTLTSLYVSRASIADIYYWWSVLDNDGNSVYKDGIPWIWFCKIDKELVRSTHFTYYVDNWNKFIGGYHPEFKDYSLIGPEFIQQKDSDLSRDAMGDLGGDPEYPGLEQPKVTEGYWIDEDGEWVMTEDDLGESLWLNDDDSEMTRTSVELTKPNPLNPEENISQTFELTEKEQEALSEKNNRESAKSITLSFKKSNTSIDEEGNTVSPQTINCAVYPNDTKNLIEALKFDPPVREGEEGKLVPMPPYVGNTDALPSERYGAYCPICDYYAYVKYEDCYCPHCGSILKLKHLRKFYKLKSIGQVDFWCLPATVISSKSYFWKNPTVVNNALLGQIKFKLGNNASNANSSSEYYGGYTNQGKGYYKPVPELPNGTNGVNDDGKVWSEIKDQDRQDIASYNDIINKINVSSNGFDTSDMNDQLIVPYSDVNGLKFFTLRHLQLLRKSVEPALGYLIGGFPDNPDFNRLRPTYENRNSATVPRYWTKARCGVQPQILAANDVGGDCFIQYWSGDPEWGSVRDYYPPGCTWWMLNNKIGIRYSDVSGYDNKGGSKVHLDDGTYGRKTQSMMCCFLHGFLPLNKKIKAAYAIIRPDASPVSRPPLGRAWTGTMYYQHYHAFTQLNKNLSGEIHENLGNHLHLRAGVKEYVSDDAGDPIPFSATGQTNANCYIRKGDTWIPGSFKSDNKWDNIDFDDNGIPHYIKKRPKKINSNFIKNELGMFKDDGRYYPLWKDDLVVLQSEYHSMFNFDETSASEMLSKTNYYFDDGWWGKLENGEPVWDYIKLEGQYENNPEWTRWGKDIVQLKTDNEIWKELTTEEFEEYLEYNKGSYTFSCSTGYGDSVSYDFTKWNNDLINNFFPYQMQNIPGYFDLSGMNSAGWQNSNIQIKPPVNDENWHSEQIIYQSKIPDKKNNIGKFQYTSGGGDNQNNSSNYYEEGGNVEKILDITSIVKKVYEERIDREFYCTAGKTLNEVMEYMKNPDESRWEGIGGEVNPEARKKWNKRYSTNDGVLLSDCYHYPILESTGSLSTKTDGEPYELNILSESGVIQSEEEFPIKVSDGTNFSISLFDINDEKSDYEIIIPVKSDNEEDYTFEELCLVLENELNRQIECKITVLENKRWKISVENCFKFKINSCALAKILGGENLEVIGIADRIISVSEYSEDNHPRGLIEGYEDSFKPKHEKRWRTDSFFDERQNFIIDLYTVPLEEYRRDWRFRQGSIDCSNCFCPNTDCQTNYPTPLEVGKWAAKKRQTMSSGQTTCPACGIDLSNESGVVRTESDGIDSFYYYEPFEFNSYLTKINIVPELNSTIYKCGYTVSCKSTNESFWRCLLNADFDKNKNIYNYWTPEDITFDGKSLDVSKANIRARYIKVEIIPNKSRIFFSGLLTSEQVKENYIYLDRTDIENDVLVDEVIRFGNNNSVPEWSLDEITENDIKIISNVVQDGKTVITLDHYPPEEITSYGFYVNKYYGGINEFDVYGVPYRSSDLTIVPSGEYEVFKYNKLGHKLTNQPLQILNVFVGISDGISTKFKESDNANLLFDVVQKTYITKDNKTLNYYVITGGNWYYSIEMNKVFIPTQAKVGDNYIDVNDFDKELRENGVFLKGIMPDQVIVSYWSTSNEGLTLPAISKENGPSYQVEIESICEISSESKNNLPDCGMSVELPTVVNGNDIKKEKKKIEWFCYNHVPATLNESTQTLLNGYFKKPTFYGNELETLSENTDRKFKELFGEHCTNISSRCHTEVTFYGKPDTIISGTITAIAPAKHKFSYSINGSDMTIEENTGGLSDGMFVLQVDEGPEKLRGRKTEAWSNPTIVVYAEDINLTEE